MAEMDCDSTAPPLLVRGIAEFNHGEYFVCHETLESLWMREPAFIRRLYQGILQVGVGLYHLQNGNYRGALNLLGSAGGYLRDFAPACMGVDVAALLAFATDLHGRLATAGVAGFGEVGFAPPPITLNGQLPAYEYEVEPEVTDMPGHW